MRRIGEKVTARLAHAIVAWSAAAAIVAPAPAADLAPQVVYGRDNRIEVFQLKGEQAALAAATVALLQGDPALSGTPVELTNPPTLQEEKKLCRGERFADQPAVAFCTGALVAPDVVLTAGHCIKTEDGGDGVALDEILFVFGYQMEDRRTPVLSFPGDGVYAAAELIKRVETDGPDYALVRLDREVTGREPLRLARNDEPPVGLPIFVIGHPSGLPAKLARGARITELRRNVFVSNLDTFGGNSGSPVFHARTNRLIGVLDEGQKDYVRQGDCKVVNRQPEVPGGEGATRISVFVAEIEALRRNGPSPPQIAGAEAR